MNTVTNESKVLPVDRITALAAPAGSLFELVSGLSFKNDQVDILMRTDERTFPLINLRTGTLWSDVHSSDLFVPLSIIKIETAPSAL